FRQLLMPATPNPFGESRYTFAQFLARSAPLHQRTALTTASPVKLETQKVEAPVVRPSIPAKARHPRFVRCHFQSELLEALLELSNKSLRLVPQSKAVNKVIRVADVIALSLVGLA